MPEQPRQRVSMPARRSRPARDSAPVHGQTRDPGQQGREGRRQGRIGVVLQLLGLTERLVARRGRFVFRLVNDDGSNQPLLGQGALQGAVAAAGEGGDAVEPSPVDVGGQRTAVEVEDAGQPLGFVDQPGLDQDATQR